MKAVSVITTSLLLLAATAEADDTAEKLSYTVKIMGADFATALLYSTGDSVYGEIRTSPKWDSVFLMDNRIATRLDKQLFPVTTELELCSKKKKSLYEIEFTDRTINVVKTHKGRVKKISKRVGRVHDLTSWLYQVRSKISENPDVLFSYKVFTGNKTYDINLAPLAEVSIDTPLGPKLAKPYKVTISRPIRYKREMIIWFEVGNSCVPLKATGKTKFGGFEVMIQRVEQKGEQNVDI